MALGWLERMYISTDEKLGSSGASNLDHCQQSLQGLPNWNWHPTHFPILSILHPVF